MSSYFICQTIRHVWFYNGRDRKKTGKIVRNGHFGRVVSESWLNPCSPCVVVCLKFIKTETFHNLLHFLYLGRILKMMVQMYLTCYIGGIFLYDIRIHKYD